MSGRLTPAERDDLIARARRLAVPVASCVQARIRPDHLIGDAARDELAALVIVLAEAADPVRLRAVAEADEDGPGVTDRDVLLLKAHAHAVALRRAGRPVPLRVRALDSEYRRGREAVKAPRVPGTLEPCGTYAAWMRHRQRGEPSEECGCADAKRRYQNAWARRARARKAAAA